MTVSSDQVYGAIIQALQAKFALVPIKTGEPPLAPNRIYLANEPYYDDAMMAHVQVTLGTLVAVQADPADAGGLVTEDFQVYSWARVARDPGKNRATQLIALASRSVLRMNTIVRSALIRSRLPYSMVDDEVVTLIKAASNEVVLMSGSPPLPQNAPPGFMCKGETYRVKYEIAWP